MLDTPESLSGRCFHSSTSHTNLRRSATLKTQKSPHGLPQKVLRLSRKVDEYKPLRRATRASTLLATSDVDCVVVGRCRLTL